MEINSDCKNPVTLTSVFIIQPPEALERNKGCWGTMQSSKGRSWRPERPKIDDIGRERDFKKLHLSLFVLFVLFVNDIMYVASRKLCNVFTFPRTIKYTRALRAA